MMITQEMIVTYDTLFVFALLSFIVTYVDVGSKCKVLLQLQNTDSSVAL